MTTTTIECTADALVKIRQEADQRPPYFGTAADLGLSFVGGFDHAEIAANRWSIKFHDRGMNGKFRDFWFMVPVAARDSRIGPEK